MNRRRFVQVLGAASVGGLAGCLTDAQSADRSPNASDSPSPSGSPTPTPSPSGPSVSIASVDAFPDDYPVTFDVSVIRADFVGTPSADDSHPATVEVTLTNEGDERIAYGLGHRTVFSTVHSDDGTYVLLPSEHDHDALAPDCWRLDEKLAFPAVVRTTELPAGESTSRQFDLLASTTADACLPAGEVTFAETYAESVASDEYTPEAREERPVQFTLDVSE